MTNEEKSIFKYVCYRMNPLHNEFIITDKNKKIAESEINFKFKNSIRCKYINSILLKLPYVLNKSYENCDFKILYDYMQRIIK